MATWNSGSRRWKGAGDVFAMVRPSRPVCLLSDAEALEYERLCAWFLTWQLLAGSCQLGPHLTVTDPAKNHAYYCERIREGCYGQVQRAMLWYLRLIFRKFSHEK